MFIKAKIRGYYRGAMVITRSISSRNALIAILIVCYTAVLTPSLHAESVFIEIQAAKLRKEPKAWAAPVTDVKYGDEVTVIETRAPWFKVRTAQNTEGYIHSTAVTARTVILKSTANPSHSIDSFEAVLAGKGFGSDTAKHYSEKAPVDFKLVDVMQQRSKIADTDLYSFMKSGGLHVTEQP